MIIGSTAIKHHFPLFSRTPNDLDIIVEDASVYDRKKGVEYLENPILLKYESGKYISPDLLLSLKISHMFWDFNWDKHMFDIQFLLKKGCKYDISIIKELVEYWKILKPTLRRSELAMTKADFFTNAVNDNVDEHDYLHTLITDTPAYTKILKDGCEVELDERKWDRLSFDEKCDVIYEETYVMAYERYKEINYSVAYGKQLKDNIIKHFPFYIAIFAMENYIRVMRPKIRYRDIINNKLNK